MPDLAAADYHDVLDGVCLVLDTLEEIRRLARGGNYGDNVLLLKHEIALRNMDLVAALHGAHQHIAVKLGGYLLGGAAHKRAPLRQAEFKQFHPASAEAVYLYRRREAQYARYLVRRCLFGVYYHGET